MTDNEGMDRNSESTWWTGTRELRVHHGNGPFSWSWEIYTRDYPPKHLVGGGGGSLAAVFQSACEYGGFNPNEPAIDPSFKFDPNPSGAMPAGDLTLRPGAGLPEKKTLHDGAVRWLLVGMCLGICLGICLGGMLVLAVSAAFG